MCRLFRCIGVIFAVLRIHFISGDLSIDQIIRAGNRKLEKDIRLVGGRSELEGRVEIRYNNVWGTVCDDRFNRKAAEVVCHMLGYERFGAVHFKRALFGEGKGPIWLDDVRCYGYERSLNECYHLPFGKTDCGHNEDVGVKCWSPRVVNKRQKLMELDLVVDENERHSLFQRKNEGHYYRRFGINKRKFKMSSNMKLMSKMAVNDPSKVWTKTIPYIFGNGIDAEIGQTISDALDEWEAYTCLDFINDVRNIYYNKIEFTANQDNKGCASFYVGMKQASQEIHLGKGCIYREIIIHEVGHALGLYHEHNRADRDRHIKIHFENIKDDKLSQFEKRPEDHYDDFNTPYDYKSIMHYGKLFFSKNEPENLITIETLRPEFQDIIGKAKHPSFLDYKIVNLLYKCSDACGNVQCPVGGYLGKNCRCYCEGMEEHTPVTLCYKEKDCPKPVINQYLYELLDKENETVIDLSYDHYPDETVINIFSTNLNCSVYSEYKCDNGTWIGQLPDCPVDLGIQLSGGSEDEGIIEVILSGQYGTICDDNWDDNDATVACRMMGFEFGKVRNEHSFGINESLPILMDDLKCSGDEMSLAECNHNGWGNHNCKIAESAAVACFVGNISQSKDIGRRGICGMIPQEQLVRRKLELRVTGGTEALKGMHPWQAGIQRKRSRWVHWCGGTIIDKYWILTAAHCLEHGRSEKMNYDDFKIFVGDHDRTKHEPSEQSFRIEYCVNHWKYTETDGLYSDYDIALIKIHSESGDGMIFNDYVLPACIPEENEKLETENKCEVSGWGKHSENGDVTDRTGADTCQGNSDGPLICDMNGRKTVMGITSWREGCGRPDSPVVYTRVPRFVKWIKDQIQLHDVVDRDECETRDICGNGICSNTYGSFKCTCNTGFESGLEEICEDINECDGPLNQCAFRCFNTKGSFKCLCPVGYQVASDGIHCEDVDECSTHANQCRYGCTNLIGTFTCICPEGFRKTGRARCSDINECREQPDLCKLGRCINLTGRFSCYCPLGFVASSDGKECLDIDECRVLPAQCQSGPCINLPGSFLCYCKWGFMASSDGKECLGMTTALWSKFLDDVNALEKHLDPHISCCCAEWKAWGMKCEICPPLGTAEYKILCPRGGGYDIDGGVLPK